MALAIEAGVVADDLCIRPFAATDVAGAHALSTSIGWPQRIEDWRMLDAHSQGYVATVAGQLIGVTLFWPFGSEVASIGAVMVDDAYRGRGIAGRLIDRCLAELEGRALLLYATAAGAPLYAKRGFEAFETVQQHQGVALPTCTPALLAGTILAPVDARTSDIIVRLAAEASGIDRSALIRSLVDHSHGALLFRDDRPAGFALYRRYGRGWGLGPVVAEDVDGGRLLIQHCLAALSNKFVRLDVPTDLQLGDWLEHLGLVAGGSALGMRRGHLPVGSGRMLRVAITTQATG